LHFSQEKFLKKSTEFLEKLIRGKLVDFFFVVGVAIVVIQLQGDFRFLLVELFAEIVELSCLAACEVLSSG